ncbi:hypothetical protein HMPREF0185_02620 [Brevundimonas diminuta 470-4]|nr:hypothetical protein HMPREF0185_02620 [Brevundimonas diminuta 470-4]
MTAPSPLVGEGGPSGPDEGCRREFCRKTRVGVLALLIRPASPSTFSHKGRRKSRFAAYSEFQEKGAA